MDFQVLINLVDFSRLKNVLMSFRSFYVYKTDLFYFLLILAEVLLILICGHFFCVFFFLQRFAGA